VGRIEGRAACIHPNVGLEARKETEQRMPITPNSQPNPTQQIPGIAHIIAVGSGKGGVGKTTVAANLALGLVAMGKRVGLMDADVYGPNIPLMMGICDRPVAVGDRIQPLEQYNLKLMSMGFVSPGDKPLVWRGPMLHGVIQQFLRQVEWGELDYLVIDLPPGTGDVQLTLMQTAPISGAIVVTTPSDVSLEDARKAINMFRQVNVPLLGIVENMSYLVVPGTEDRIDVFGAGGGKRTAEAMNVPFLGEVPLDPEIRKGGDSGRPVGIYGDTDPRGLPFMTIAREVIATVAGMGERKGPSFSVGE
jgi:ATP-binding protein involved in chromosome partitioning